MNLRFEIELTAIRRARRRSALLHPIEEVVGFNHTEKQPVRMSQDECIHAIDRGDRVFVTDADGRKTDVQAHIHFPPWSLQGIRYITTSQHNTRADALLDLPED